MNPKAFILCISFISTGLSSSYAQEIKGSWQGTLKVMQVELPLIFHFDKVDGSYVTTLDSPAQGATGIKADSTGVDGKDLLIHLRALGAEYKAVVSSQDSIKGTFSQSGQRFPLTLGRKKD